MSKIGFLFGAGAEICYDLPSGGKFALDIFRQDVTTSKQEFIEMRKSIDRTTTYAGTWLPEDFETRSVSSFGKTVVENIVKDTLEHKRDNIICYLNNFDRHAEKRKRQLVGIDIDKVIFDLINRKVSDCQLNSLISFNPAFQDGDMIFKSNYFSALLLIYRDAKLNISLRSDLKKIMISFLQVQIGALGSSLVKNINDSLFKSKDENIDIFDDIGEVLRLNYQSAGVIGIDFLFENNGEDYNKSKFLDNNSSDSQILYFAKCLLEDFFSSVLDYKSLIDSNWHYLYCPRNEWAKFCKISIFLLMVKNYIKQKIPKVISNEGYYDDLKQCMDNKQFELTKVATTNYNGLIKDKIEVDVTFLNGSVTQWYDPHLNKIDIKDKLGNKFIVPLLFTQSGTKPMTSIYKSCEYVDLYRSWKESDYVIIVGFGFNKDDEHINGIIRTLVNEDNKKIVIVNKAMKKKEIIKTLVLNREENITVYNVDEQRNIENIRWIDYIIKNAIST